MAKLVGTVHENIISTLVHENIIYIIFLIVGGLGGFFFFGG